MRRKQKSIISKEFKRPDYLGRYKVKIVIIKDGFNDHFFRRVNDFPITINDAGKKYKVEVGGLNEVKRGFIKRLTNMLKLISMEYMILFWEGEKKPIIRSDSSISPQVLRVTRTSRSVTGMIKEWFAGKGRTFPVNKWVFIIIVALIGTIIYAKMSGRI